MKKFISIAVVFILVFCLSFPISAQQANVISLSRIAVEMPEVTFEINGTGYEKNDISATLDSQKLDIVDVKKYENTEHTVCGYILVDLSTSMADTIGLVKRNIISYINTLDENDKIILITFGETEVKTVLNGDESRQTAIDVVNGLKCNEQGTLFYEALSRAYQLSQSSNDKFDRKYVIAFSDGIDVQMGSSTFDEVLKQYDSHALPLYAACAYDASKDSSDKFGEMSRASGGIFEFINNDDSFNDFLSKINDVTIVKATANSNYVDGQEKQLSVKIGSSQVDYNIPVIRSISDTQAPTVSKLTYDSEKGVFVVAFSEKVIGATATSAYKITKSNGKSIEVSEVFYSEQENHYEIKTKDPIYIGKYNFEFSGIKDDSKEANAVVEKQVVKVTKSDNTVKLVVKIIVIVLIVIVLITAFIILIAVLLFRKKRSQNNVDIINSNNNVSEIQHNNQGVGVVEYNTVPDNTVKHHIKVENIGKIQLRIKTGRTVEQLIETDIVSSLIVGRSNTCDICIDDTKLSRQHFVIENDNGNFYVMDLQSRNGTMLNGIRISGRQRITSGDKVVAGLSDIVINILGR